jgi:hypothetical protein
MDKGGLALNKSEDLEVIRQARPYVRSILAFVAFLRWGREKRDAAFCYEMADVFLDQLRADVKKQEPASAEDLDVG